jgi:hypothetical protein
MEYSRVDNVTWVNDTTLFLPSYQARVACKRPRSRTTLSAPPPPISPPPSPLSTTLTRCSHMHSPYLSCNSSLPPSIVGVSVQHLVLLLQASAPVLGRLPPGRVRRAPFGERHSGAASWW